VTDDGDIVVVEGGLADQGPAAGAAVTFRRSVAWARLDGHDVEFLRRCRRALSGEGWCGDKQGD